MVRALQGNGSAVYRVSPAGRLLLALGLFGALSGVSVAAQLSAPTMTALPIYTKSSSVSVTWGAGANGAPGGYSLQWSASSTFSPLIGSSSPASTATSATIASLTSGKKVYFRIQAKASGSWTASAWSATISTTPDTVLPTAAIIVPGSSKKYPLAPLTLSGTASDASSGIAQVEVAFASAGPWSLATGTTSWSTVWTPPAAGAFTVYVRSTDGAGNLGTSVSRATTVVAPPAVAITAPAAGASLPQAAYTIKGTASSSGSSISKVEVGFGSSGPWTAATGTTSWSYSWTPSTPGAYALYARATDAVGNTTTGPALAVVVAAPPNVAITAPAAGAVLTKAAYSVQGTASSTGSSVTKVEVGFTSAGPWYAATGTGSWTYTWTPSAGGSFSLYARATDAAGNKKTSTAVAVTVVAPPNVAVAAPATGSVLPPGPYSISGTASSPGSSVTKVEIRFSTSGTWHLASGTDNWTYAWAAGVGTYSISARATDALGATKISSAVSASVAAPPSVAITSPGSGNLLPQAPYTVRGTASSAGSTVAKVEVGFSASGPWFGASGTTSWSYTATPDTTGTLSVYARATDAVGSATISARVSFTVVPPPSVAVGAPAPDSSLPLAPYVLSGSASSAGSTVARVEVGFNDIGPWTLATGTTSWTSSWTPSTPGTYSLYARATDAVGNATTSGAVAFTVAAPPPTVAITSPADYSNLPLAVRTISGTADSAYSTVSRVDVGFTSDGPWTPANGTTSWSFAWTPPVPGAYTIYARAVDALGHLAEASAVTVTVVGPPALAILTPSDSGSLPFAPFVLTGTAGLTAETVEVGFSAGGPWSPVNGTSNWTYPWAPTASGAYTIYARATDAIGNVIVSPPTRVTVVAPPSISIAGPSEGGVLGLGPYTVRGSADSSGSTVSTVDVAFEAGGPWQSATGTASWSLLWTPDAPGTYSIYARATDAIGNETTTQVSALVAAPPVVAIAAPAAGDLVPLTSEMVAGTAGSADSSIAKVEIAFDENGPWTRAAGTTNWSYAWSPAAAGSYTLYARATDAVGNVTVGAPVGVVVPSPPTVAVTAPIAGNALPWAPFTVTGTAGSTASTIAVVEVAFASNGPWSEADGTANWSFTWSPAAGGNYTIYVRATDALGNRTVGAPVSFVLTTPPAVSTTVPGNGGVLGLAPVAIAGTSSSENSTVVSVEISFGDGSWQPASGTDQWTYSWVPPAPGSYALRIRATDATGNVTTGATTPFTIAAPPVVAVSSPGNGGVVAFTNQTIRGTASSAASAVSVVEVAFSDGGPWMAADGTTGWTFAWTPPSAGSYQISTRATDAVGNVTLGSAVPFVVAAPPDVAIAAPAGSETFSWGPYTIRGTSLSADSSVVKVEIGFDPAGPWFSADGLTNWTYSWTPESAIPYTIYARASDAAGNVTISPAAAVSVTPPPADTVSFYKTAFDAEYTKDQATLDSLAARGDGPTYYTFSYVLDGTLSMFEATGDVTYLERTLTWAETMMSKATIVDFKGKKNWNGAWSTPSIASVPIAFQLDDLQGSTELARLARIILTSPALRATYETRGMNVYTFVRDNILNKWLFDRGSISWYHNVSSDTTKSLNDKVALHLLILRDISVTSLALNNGDSATYNYEGMLTDLASGYVDHFGKKPRFEPYGGGGGIIWDRNLGPYGPIPPQDANTLTDTSHANRYPRAMIALYETGRAFTLQDILGVDNLLKRTIWNQSYLDPRFTNFYDGSNITVSGRGPWAAGQIYSGWTSLAVFDEETLRLVAQAFRNILANKMNPSLTYMSTIYGRLELPGALARAVALRSAGP